jgi:mRNA-degrading endonuclease YafQ of YafQ-DinJ toxin-antitoxin module
MMNMMFWPAKSPDLSPIEQVWAYIKKKLKGRVYTSPTDLSDAISEKWTKVPQDVIKNLWDSFRARCEVCAKYHGECLNWHWKEVHEIHHRVDISQVYTLSSEFEQIFTIIDCRGESEILVPIRLFLRFMAQ